MLQCVLMSRNNIQIANEDCWAVVSRLKQQVLVKCCQCICLKCLYVCRHVSENTFSFVTY